MTQYFQTMRKWKHPKPSAHYFYALHYHQAQRYSYPEYILGLKKLTLTNNMISTKEDVNMDHPCLKELTSLYPMHL